VQAGMIKREVVAVISGVSHGGTQRCRVLCGGTQWYGVLRGASLSLLLQNNGPHAMRQV